MDRGLLIMKNNTTFYMYPDGYADKLPISEFVWVRANNGDITNKRVDELVKGDFYAERVPSPLPPRGADEILEFMAKWCLGIRYVRDPEFPGSEPIKIEVIDKNNLEICSYPYANTKTCIRDAIEPIMDNEEL
jgi:hypothetical protein